MAEKKETAEQKLLKIIETQKPEGESKPAPANEAALQAAAAVKNSGLPAFSVSSILSPLMALLKGRGPHPSSDVTFGPKEINKVLAMAVLITGIFFSANLFSGMRLLKQQVRFNLDSAITQNESDFAPTFKALTEYLSRIQKRNIFQPYEKKEIPKEEAIPAETRRIVSLVKNLKVVGISWLDSPESASVMIEDTAIATTYFLKEGEKIHDMTIKTIYADRIIVSYEDEEMTIKL